jgi:hypothetical protein
MRNLFTRNINAHFLGESFNAINKFKPIIFHHKGERITARATVKAMIKLLLITHRKTGIVITIMERAFSAIATTFLLKFYVTINKINNIGTCERSSIKFFGIRPAIDYLLMVFCYIRIYSM